MSSSTSSLIIVQHVGGGRAKFLPRGDTYKVFIARLKRQFRISTDTPIALFNDELPICRGVMVEVTDDAFEHISQVARTFLWQEETDENTQDGPDAHSCYLQPQLTMRSTEAALGKLSTEIPRGSVSIIIKTYSGKLVALQVDLAETVEKLKQRILASEGLPIDQQRLIFAGWQLADGNQLRDYNITAHSAVHLVLRLSGGKPVIHLFSPQEMEATVSLSLNSAEWKSSARYPEPAISQSTSHEVLRWNVKTHLNGNLTVILPSSDEVEVTSLFWEADTIASLRPFQSDSVQSSTSAGDETFFPTKPRIDPRDAVLLSIENVPLYLDRALKTLTLPVEARTSFITFVVFLPSPPNIRC